MEKIEKFVRKYLRNKLSYDEYVMKNIDNINGEILRLQNHVGKIELEDIVLPERKILPVAKGSVVRDPVHSAFLQWEKLQNEIKKDQERRLKEYIKALDYYISLKLLYEHITCILYQLSPNEREVIDLYMQGHKYDLIACDLKCCKSKTTLLIKRSIASIVKGLDVYHREYILKNT